MNKTKEKFYIEVQGVDGSNVYLVDRGKSKSSWWTRDKALMMAFRKRDAAVTQLLKLRFNNPKVVNRLNFEQVGCPGIGPISGCDIGQW